MTTLAPNMPVTWQTGPASHPIKLAGHVVSVNCSTARVRANGEVYEVEIEKLQAQIRRKHLRPSCLLCGKPCDPEANYCSHEHYREALHKRTADTVFQAIVDYKLANDGISPLGEQICEATGLSKMTVARTIHKLEKSGRIRCEWRGQRREIFVPGGRWVYEEVQS